MLGENLASTEGDAWRRHRRIAAPAFNHTTYRNVWDTTARVFEEMKVTEGWNGMPEANVANVGTITHKVLWCSFCSVICADKRYSAHVAYDSQRGLWVDYALE